MDLTYITLDSEPSKQLADCFDSVRVIKVEPTGLHDKVGSTEKEMREKGSVPFDVNDFVLCTIDLEELGEVIGRNRLNVGVAYQNNDQVDLGPYFARRTSVRIGDTPIRLINASSLPYYQSGKVLFVAPHFEEETAIYLAYLHKKAGDNVHIAFVTDIPDKPGYEKKSHKVYQEIIGLTPEEYSFMGFKDRTVPTSATRFEKTLQEKIEEFKPDTVIMPPKGSNFDHNAVLNFSMPVINERKLDLLLGEVVQNTRLRPSIWPVFDWSVVERLTDAYADGFFGGAQYKPMVRNLFRKLPEALNRYVADLKVNKGFSQDIGVFGLQPVILENGYRVPHDTTIF